MFILLSFYPIIHTGRFVNENNVNLTRSMFECNFGTRLCSSLRFYNLMKKMLLLFAPYPSTANQSSGKAELALALTPRNMLREESNPAA
jgi:hypothetical protein